MSINEKTMNLLKKKILRQIKPGIQEKKQVDEFSKELLHRAKILGEHYMADPVIVGSTGKGTWLREDHDIDLFLVMPRSFSRERLEKDGMALASLLAKQLKAKTTVKYAEHPYLRAELKYRGVQYKLDIVPCFRLEPGQKIQSAVDRSPLHLVYILENLKSEFRDDVRLLKQFCKGIGVYSSDAKTEGVSGYMLELLAMQYGRFEDVLRQISIWKPGYVVDTRSAPDRHTVSEKATRFRPPLVVIDPVDIDRNVASVMSPEKFVMIVQSARAFLKKPSADYFFPKPGQPLSTKEIKELQQRNTKFIAVMFDRPDIIDDTLYPQLRRVLRRLEALLGENAFRCIRTFEWADEHMCILLFELEVWLLPNVEKRVGPPISSEKHSKEFLDKYSKSWFGPYVEGDEWVIEKRRQYQSASELFIALQKMDEKKLLELGIPNHIAPVLDKARILEHKDAWAFISKNKPFSQFLRKKYFCL